MTWWGWAVGAVLVLYPICVWAVLFLATPRPVDGELQTRGKPRVLHVWKGVDRGWVAVSPPGSDETIRFSPMVSPPPRSGPMHCRDVWRPM